MKRLRPFSFALVASAVLAWTLPVYATGDCNNGKAIYNKKINGVPVSCSQDSCHKSSLDKLQTGLFDPGLIDSQLEFEPQMQGLRQSLNLSPSDIHALATFIFYSTYASP